MASELPTAAVVNPTAEVAVSSKTDVEGLGAKLNRFFDKVYVDPTTKINEDPFGEFALNLPLAYCTQLLSATATA